MREREREGAHNDGVLRMGGHGDPAARPSPSLWPKQSN